MASKSKYFKQNKAKVSRKKLRIDTSGKETGASKGRRFVLWGGITAIIALFVVVGTAGLGTLIAPPNQVVLSSESHAIDVFSPNGSKLPFALVSNTAEYTTTSNTTYILTNVTAGEMARNNVGKLSVNLTSKAVSPSMVSTSADSGAKPDSTTGATYNVTFTEENLTHLTTSTYWYFSVFSIGGHTPVYTSPINELNTSVTTTLPNGTYYATANTYNNSFIDPFISHFTVSGAAVHVFLSYEHVYSTTVKEKGVQTTSSSSLAYECLYERLSSTPHNTTTSSPYYITNCFFSTSSAYVNCTQTQFVNGTYSASFYAVNCSTHDLVAYAAPSQIFTINGANATVYANFSAAYPIVLKESGLPSSVNWTATTSINGGSNTFYDPFNSALYVSNATAENATTSSEGYLLNGTYGITGYAYDAATHTHYAAVFQTATVNGAVTTVNMTFETAYNLTVNEARLKLSPGTSWVMHLSTGQNLTSFSSDIIATLVSGNYSYTITASGYNSISGSFSLSANKILNVTFPMQFTVMFNEKGLPSGKSWTVIASHTFSGSAAAGRVITLSLTNGSYAYQVLSNDTAMAAFPGDFTIAGANLTVNVTFSKAYNVTFHETGLPANTMWFVNLTVNGAEETVFNFNASHITANMSASLSNATYQYTGFGFNNTTKDLYMTSFGNFTVKGANLTVNLTFARGYAVIFLEKGLPSGTSWYIKLNTGQVMASAPLKLNSTTNVLAVFGFLMEGNYTYTPRISIAGYTASPGKLDLSNNTMVNVTFTKVLSPSPLITATITIGFGTSVSNFVPVVSNVTNISYAMLLIQPYFLTGNQSNHLMIEVNTSAGSGLKYVTFELLGNNGTFSSFGPIYAEDFGYVAGGTIILALTFASLPWIAIYREEWVMSGKKVS